MGLKLFDFECSQVGCDKRFEVFKTDDEDEKCPDCGAPAVKMLGGKPALSVGQERMFQQAHAADLSRYEETETKTSHHCLPLGDKATDPHLHLTVQLTKNKAPKAKA